MSELTIALELTPKELVAAMAAASAIVACSKAAATRHPDDIARYDTLHALSHETLAAAPSYLGKLQEAAEKIVPILIAERGCDAPVNPSLN